MAKTQTVSMDQFMEVMKMQNQKIDTLTDVVTKLLTANVEQSTDETVNESLAVQEPTNAKGTTVKAIAQPASKPAILVVVDRKTRKAVLYESNTKRSDYMIRLAKPIALFDTTNEYWNAYKDVIMDQLASDDVLYSEAENGIWASTDQRDFAHRIKAFLVKNNLWQEEWPNTDQTLRFNMTDFKALAVDNGMNTNPNAKNS
jgi:hypothetical protein